MLERVVADALDLRANYLDLRHPEDVVTWARDNPDLVEDFAVNGGYRIGPIEATLPAEVGTDGAELSVAWQNTGSAGCPTTTPSGTTSTRWPTRCLIPTAQEPGRRVTSVADPGGWYSGRIPGHRRADLAGNPRWSLPVGRGHRGLDP